MKLMALVVFFAATGVANAQSCFGRYYDDAHLDAHPEQGVQEIFFGTLTGRPILQVRLEGSQNYIYGYADCRDTGNVLACNLENNQGNFSIRAEPDGTIMLFVGASDVYLERGGDQQIVYLQHDAGDDRVFRLYQGKGCMW